MNRFIRSAAALGFAAIVAAAPAAADVWKIDGTHSSASFAVTHLMISTVRGDFGSMSGTLEYDGKSVSSIKVDATIDATTISTNNEKRDAHLKDADFFDVANHPTIKFKSTKVVPAADGSFKLVGDLTMRGVTKEVTLDVAAPSPVIKGRRGESLVGASATTKIDRQDFGVKYNSPLDTGGVAISDTVKITIDIEAMRPPAAPPAAAPVQPKS